MFKWRGPSLDFSFFAKIEFSFMKKKGDNFMIDYKLLINGILYIGWMAYMKLRGIIIHKITV